MSIVVRRTGQPVRSGDAKPNRHAVDVVLSHLGEIGPAVAALRRESSRLAEWGEELARARLRDAKVFAAGSDGSAHEAQRFASELTAHDAAHHPDGNPGTFKAIVANKESGQTISGQIPELVNRGDIVVLLAAKGITDDLRDAASAAKKAGAKVWALTGRESKDLAQAVNEAVNINTDPPHAEEAHLVAVLALCECFDEAMREVNQ